MNGGGRREEENEGMRADRLVGFAWSWILYWSIVEVEMLPRLPFTNTFPFLTLGALLGGKIDNQQVSKQAVLHDGYFSSSPKGNLPISRI